MFKLQVIAALALLAPAAAQQIESQQAEVHPPMSYYECAADGSCVEQVKEIVLDSNWRWADVDATNCYLGNTWDTTLCPDEKTCAKACSIEGADYNGTYGIDAKGDALKLRFVTNGTYSRSVGSRSYMMDDTNTYKQWFLKNKEFSFISDVSNIGCGLNGALYFVEMDKTGNMGDGSNAVGAEYGTGYCDAQCPHDLKWINGEANLLDWVPSSNNGDTGTGKYGTCCFELDIWEANGQAQQTTPHTCSVDGQYRCSSAEECGDNDGIHRDTGVCDKNGCDFNPSRMGFDSYFGRGADFDIDTTKPFTVVTQFITADGTDEGDLSEIRRFYVQDDKVIDNVKVSFDGSTEFDSITDDFCEAKTEAFTEAGDIASFANRGGMKNMGDSMGRGLTLVLSLWDDYDANMLWLDAAYPTNETVRDVPGVHRGPCDVTSGVPSDIEAAVPDSTVGFASIKTGPIGFTMAAMDGSDDTPAPAGDDTPATDCAVAYEQCGGSDWEGTTCCVDGTTCVAQNAFYSQCVPPSARK